MADMVTHTVTYGQRKRYRIASPHKLQELMNGYSDKQAAIAARLAQRVEDVGIAQADLAKLADTSKQQIYKLTKGIVALSPKWAERIAPHLQVSASWLLMIGDDANASPPVPSLEISEDALHTKQEEILLGIWRRLAKEQRDRLVSLLEVLTREQRSDAA